MGYFLHIRIPRNLRTGYGRTLNMGKARALKLGIVKGVATIAKVVLPDTYKCPVCKYIFTAYDVALEAKTTGKSAEEIVAGHIKDCIARVYPNQKSECLM